MSGTLTDQAASPEPADAVQTPEGLPPVVCLLSGDLIFASRIRSAAEQAGLQFELSGNVAEKPRREVVMVIVDLSTRSGIVSELMERCQNYVPQADVIAYGPHVQAGRLKEARQAGIPTVLTRGQFDAALGSLFAGV